MKRTISTLNDMSFILPEGYRLVEDRYNLMNGQGFINRENYLSEEGGVISFFELHRDPDEFFESYSNLCQQYSSLTDKFELVGSYNLKLNGFEFPTYIIKGYSETLIYIVQVFINCGDCLGCFMINVPKFEGSLSQLSKDNKLFSDLIKVLRTVE